MNILLVHNYYQQPGGEDQVFADETRLLRDRGHAVRQHTVHNDAVGAMGRVELLGKTIWNRAAYDELRAVARQHRADVVHFHNTFPLVSPAGYRAAHDAGAAVVQTLHNYRLLCPVATFYRDGGVCEDCMGKTVPWPGVVHRCYRGSLAASAAVAAMLTVNRAMRTYTGEVDRYIALTEFSRRKFVEGGLPAEKIVVKPNFVDPDPGVGDGGGGFALFVGRLTEEKGVPTLLNAWRSLDGAIPLKVLGDGPLRTHVLDAAAQSAGAIEYLGRRTLEEVCGIMGEAGALVFPSEWYEGLPRTIVESFAKGTPVIASRLGSMAELVEDGCSGFLFRPGDPSDLAGRVRHAWVNKTELAQMRRRARLEFEQKYTADSNHEVLVRAYRAAMACHHRGSDRGTAGAEPDATNPAAARDAAQGERTPPTAASH